MKVSSLIKLAVSPASGGAERKVCVMEYAMGLTEDQERLAERIHKNVVVLDGLVYRCDDYDPALEEGGVTAVHTTACRADAGFRDALGDIAAMLKMLKKREDKLMPAVSTADILDAKKRGKIAVVFGFQNARPIETNLDYLYIFYGLGIRIIQLTYNERNFAGDGCLEPANGGLSRFGVKLVKAMNKLGILIDLSHVGEKTIFEAIEQSEHPVVFTHANPRARADNPRNKTDAQIKALAEKGGVMGLAAYGPICWNPQTDNRPTLEDLIAHIDYVVDLVGIDHVGLGNDFPMGVPQAVIDQFIQYINTHYPQMSDGYNRVGGDTFKTRYPIGIEYFSKFPNITRALVKKGYSEEAIAKVLGGNFLRVFKQVWGA